MTASHILRIKAPKAVELGISQRTLERWIGHYRSSGEFGLVDGRQKAPDGLAPSLDARWLSMAKVVLDEQIREPKVTKAIVMARIEARLAKVHGAAEVPVPGRSTVYKALAALDRGRSTFDGSTKRKRSNANRPQGAYGEIRATHPGEYVLMDTTPLNVFALSPVTGKCGARRGAPHRHCSFARSIRCPNDPEHRLQHRAVD